MNDENIGYPKSIQMFIIVQTSICCAMQWVTMGVVWDWGFGRCHKPLHFSNHALCSKISENAKMGSGFTNGLEYLLFFKHKFKKVEVMHNSNNPEKQLMCNFIRTAFTTKSISGTPRKLKGTPGNLSCDLHKSSKDMNWLIFQNELHSLSQSQHQYFS